MLNKIQDRVPRQESATALAIVARNSFANFAKIGALSVTVFLLPPILVRSLDKPTYATWMLILQAGTYVAIFDGSIQSAVSRFVARSRGLKDDLYMGRMMSSAGLVMLIGAALTAILTIVGTWQLSRLFQDIPLSIRSDAQNALLIFGISLAISLPFNIFAGAFLGLKMNHVNAVAGSVGRLLGAGGTAWAAYSHQGMVAMAVWTALGCLLQALLYLLAWLRLHLRGMIRWALITRAALREFLNFCYAMFATHIGSLLITGMDIPIVAAFDFRAAGYYAVAATLSTMLSVPQSAIIMNLIPVAAEIGPSGTPARMGEIVLKATRYSTAILCLIALPLIVGMSPFLYLWVGPDYARHAMLIALILVIAQFIRLTLMPYAAIGFAAGQQNRMLVSPLGEGVVNLICSLIGAWLLGAVGVALGTLVGACAGDLFHFFNSMPRTDSMAFGRLNLARTGILKPILYCLPAFVPALLLGHYVPGAIGQCIAVFGGELLALLLLWKLNFAKDEQDELLSLAMRSLRIRPGSRKAI